jgi:predicted amidohydrolase
MKIYGCQFDIAWEDKTANYQKVRDLLNTAKPQAGSVVFLPEMFATGFSMNVAAIAEDPASGPTVKFLAECAVRLGVYMVGGFVTRNADGKGRNELAVVAPNGAMVAQYAKIHPFTYGQESLHYVGGERICSFAWNDTKIAPFICYDLRFPEIFRHATRGGAEVLAIIANWPQKRDEHWQTLLRARAIENQTYIIGVNRCGSDPIGPYSGRSLIVDPQGMVLADGQSKEGTISAEIDLAALRAYREKFPVLADIRPQFLGDQS